MHVIGSDQHTAAKQILGKLAEASAFVQSRLCGGCPVRGIRLMKFQPESLVALSPRLDSGFRESGTHRFTKVQCVYGPVLLERTSRSRITANGFSSKPPISGSAEERFQSHSGAN